MSRRPWVWVRECAHDGCTERARYEYATKRDMLHASRLGPRVWHCLRHSRTETVLSLANTHRVTEVVAAKSTRYPDLPGLYWGSGSGFAHGLGWKAWADDFPEGTRLRVTVEVIPPDDDASSE